MIRRPALAPLLYGALLAAMAAGQAASFGAFRDAVAAYDALGDARIAALAILGIEVFAAAGLLLSASVPGLGRAAAVAGVAVALAWFVLAAQAFARGLDLDNCGCFGAYLAQPLRWWILLEDVYMVVLAGLAARSVGVRLPAVRARRPTGPAQPTGEWP